MAASPCLWLFVAVLVSVVLAGFFGVMNRVHMMAMGDVGVMPGLFMIARLVMLGGREMVFRGVTMVLGSFAVMFRAFF